MNFIKTIRDITGRFTASEKLVLMIMATYADYGTGANIRPSISTLMKQTGLTKMTVLTAIKSLIKKEVLLKVQDNSAVCKQSLYQLNLPLLDHLLTSITIIPPKQSYPQAKESASITIRPELVYSLDQTGITIIPNLINTNTYTNTDVSNVLDSARATPAIEEKKSDLIKTAEQPVSNCKRMLDRYNKPIVVKAKEPEVEIHTEIQLEEIPQHHISSACERRAQEVQSVEKCVQDAMSILLGKSYECKAMHKGYDRGFREPGDLRYMKLHNPVTGRVRY